jgi:hypothetical protein
MSLYKRAISVIPLGITLGYRSLQRCRKNNVLCDMPHENKGSYAKFEKTSFDGFSFRGTRQADPA